MDSSTHRLYPQETTPMSAPHVPLARTTGVLPAPTDPRLVLGPHIQRHSNLVALSLIALGILLYVGHVHLVAALGAAVPLSLGLIFLYVYDGHNPNMGFLISGLLLAGLGAGGFVGMLIGLPGLIGVGLGLGFGAIWYLHRAHWWALIPGALLVIAGLATVVPGHLFAWLLPLMLVVVGLRLLLLGRRPAWRR